MPGRNPKDVQVSQDYRYGPKNRDIAVLNDYKDFTGVRGYPSDDEYMKTVGESNLERDQAAMRVQADEAQKKAGGPKAKPASYASGGRVQKTGMALVHEGELIIPKKEADARATRIIAPNGGWLVCPENAGKYTGKNADWRQ